MGRIEQLVKDVLEEGTFDATAPQALRWLSRRQRLMCSRSRCFRKSLELGPTVAGQQEYAVPSEALEIREVKVNGIRWGPGRHEDIADGNQSWLWLERITGSGIAMREDSAGGATMLAVFPIPEGGLALTAYAVCEPPDLLESDDSTLVIPATMEDALVNGAIATGLLRLEARPDIATPFEQMFNAACEELARETARRFRGSGPARIRVIGINA